MTTQRTTNAVRWLVSLLAVSLLASGRAPVVPAAGPPAAPETVSGFSAPSGYIVHGAHINPVLGYNIEVANFESQVGKPLGLLMYFRPWDWPTAVNSAGPCDDGYLPRYAFPDLALPPGTAGGRAIMITWEPLNTAGLGNPGPADYDNILSGQFDTLINKCADELKAWSNKTFLIRFMHEMNIPDAPWWAGYSYNQKPDGTGDTDKYKQVWRYVWQKFRNRGVTNVQWVWSPNFASNPNKPWNDMNNYYPGDQYVDWIGLSGYNWMGVIPFQSYSFLYNSALASLQCRYAKPIMHAEIGSAPYSSSADMPPNKEGWIADAYQRAQTFPLVRAVVWFNDFANHDESKSDFRIWYTPHGYSSPPPGVPASVTNAYAAAIADSRFTSSFNAAQLINPPMTRCSSDAVSSNGVLSARPAAAMVGRTGSSTVNFAIAAFGLTNATNFTIRGCPGGATCKFVSSNSTTSSGRAAPWSGDTLIVTVGPGTTLGTFTLTIGGGGTSVPIQLSVVQNVRRVFLSLVGR